MDLVLPASLQELLALLVGNVLFLGAVSAALTGAVARIVTLPENGTRAVSLAVPVVVALLALLFQVLLYGTPVDAEVIYGVLKVAVGVIAGKQIIYTAYQGLKSNKPVTADAGVTAPPNLKAKPERVVRGEQPTMPLGPLPNYGPPNITVEGTQGPDGRPLPYVEPPPVTVYREPPTMPSYPTVEDALKDERGED